MADSAASTGLTVLFNPDTLTRVLDVLVVGGGPAGTAAGLRARELGLDVHVVDYDDVMKRIRDYSKDKLILPSFGGGDKASFPDGGQFIGKLPFEPIDKDELVESWKSIYHEAELSVQTGVEFIGLVDRIGDAWNVRCYDHKRQSEAVFRARHVVISIGRGVPRRMDIPGDTAEIARSLKDARDYVGAPACVIGGGTSAAEAVIAISCAKLEAGDESSIYWSYRGTRMPKVSKALGDVFFDAFIRNGNIQYLRESDPVVVITGPDHREYLSIRVDRKHCDGRPDETVHLEFPKAAVLACIGEDLPTALLSSLGIDQGTGPDGKTRMVVTGDYETQQPGVHLIGDLLSQAFWLAPSFDAPVDEWVSIKHPGNIKTALNDGVAVAEAISARLGGSAARPEPPPAPLAAEDPPEAAAAGDEDDDSDFLRVGGSGDVPIGDAGTPDSKVREVPEEPAPLEPAGSAVDARPEPAAPADKVAATSGITKAPPQTTPTVQIYRVDPSGLHEPATIKGSMFTFGRKACDFSLPHDDLVSGRHASIVHNSRANAYELRDEGSETGTWIRLRRPSVIQPGTLLSVGRQRLYLGLDEAGGGELQIFHHDVYDERVATYPLPEGVTVVGRNAPVTIAADDRALSRRHVAFVRKGQEVEVRDLQSANGTLLRLKGLFGLAPGDEFIVGRSLFSFAQEPGARDQPEAERATSATSATGKSAAIATTPEEPAAAVESVAQPPLCEVDEVEASPAVGAAAPVQDGPPSVTFEGYGTYRAKGEMTVLEIAEENGIPMDYSCRNGICGADPVDIVSGQQFLNPCGDEEQEALETMCGVEEGEPCRLACMARVTGPVVCRIRDMH